MYAFCGTPLDSVISLAIIRTGGHNRVSDWRCGLIRDENFGNKPGMNLSRMAVSSFSLTVAFSADELNWFSAAGNLQQT